jgi:hypothetical protein
METQQITNEDLEKLTGALGVWGPLTQNVEPTVPDRPCQVLLGEALDLGHAAKVYWEPGTGKDPHPGMKAAVVNGLITDSIGTEIIGLALAITHAQWLYRRASSNNREAPVDEGEYLLFEIKGGLQFLFDDGNDDVNDAELARLSKSHSDTSTHDGLAMSLEGFALFANEFRDQLATLPGFDISVIPRAATVARELREQSALKSQVAAESKQREYLALRNSLITLLLERMQIVRRAARFVFRQHPGEAKWFSSEYERKQRARQRAARKAQEQATQEVTP